MSALRTRHPAATNAAPALELRSFGVSIGGRVILTEVDLALPTAGMTVLVGPAGCGKSTLLRTLAGLNDAHPSLLTWGEVRIGDYASTLPDGIRFSEMPEAPSLVQQHARFYVDTLRENLASALPNRARLTQCEQRDHVMNVLADLHLHDLVTRFDDRVVSLPLLQQRQLAIARALLAQPAVLFVDEADAGLDDDDAGAVVHLIRAEATRRAVVFVTHNQRHALAAGGVTALLSGGAIREVASTRSFFSSPRTAAGRRFVATGRCELADPAEGALQTDDDEPGGASQRLIPVAPRGFYWVEHGRLGGMPRPGILGDLEDDLGGLQQLGVTVLVNLEEAQVVDPDLLASRGIRLVQLPIVDMDVPSVKDALDLCSRVDEWIRDSETVAFHCRAGLGRTGTLLACRLVHAGSTAREAIDRIRAINRFCIQSDAQVEFLRAFEDAVAVAPGSTAGHP